jgi:hypothetical protein
MVSKASAGLLSTTRTSIGVSDFTRKRPGEEEGDMCTILLSTCEGETTPTLLRKGLPDYWNQYLPTSESVWGYASV